MEDMKKLVEKYKRELMEYSRQAPKPEKLSFPEMLPEEPPAQGVQEIPFLFRRQFQFAGESEYLG